MFGRSTSISNRDILRTGNFQIIYTLIKKKVLVHCHAGYGRTGITIDYYKIFDDCISAYVTKKEISKIKPKCIQSKEQLIYNNFYIYFHIEY